MVGQNGNQNSHHSKLSDLQRTKPPSFSQVIDPLDAYDWLRTIERKLEIAHTEEDDKVPLAAIILKALPPYGGKMQKPCGLLMKKSPGKNLRISFGKYHIPTGVMKVKQREFLVLLQGSQSVGEYLQKFNHLARYSLYDVAIKERNIDRFLG